ncbi:MAG: peptidase inhibitor family I36 protein [Candidatus Dormibacteraceae bacterium]
MKLIREVVMSRSLLRGMILVSGALIILNVIAVSGLANQLPGSTKVVHAVGHPIVVRGSGLEACGSGELCLYEDANYNLQHPTSRIWKDNFNNCSAFGEDLAKESFNDVTSSWVNNSNSTPGVWGDAPTREALFDIPALSQVPHLGDKFNKKASNLACAFG